MRCPKCGAVTEVSEKRGPFRTRRCVNPTCRNDFATCENLMINIGNVRVGAKTLASDAPGRRRSSPPGIRGLGSSMLGIGRGPSRPLIRHRDNSKTHFCTLIYFHASAGSGGAVDGRDACEPGAWKLNHARSEPDQRRWKLDGAFREPTAAMGGHIPEPNTDRKYVLYARRHVVDSGS